MLRVVSAGMFIYGNFFIAPMNFMADDISLWWTPAIVLGSTVPACCAYLTGTAVSSINVHLLPAARSSKAALQRFAKKTPLDTLMTFTFIRFLPWPTHKKIFLSDLRRLPTATFRLSNLEHMPLGAMKKFEALQHSGPFGRFMAWWTRRYDS